MRILQGLAFFLTVFAVSASATDHKPKVRVRAATSCEDKLKISSDRDALYAHAIGSTLSMESVKEYLRLISGETPLESGFRLDNRGGNNSRAVSRLVIEDLVHRLGYEVIYEKFPEGMNLIVEIPGHSRDNEVVEITAHYDSRDNPGADDNGSGVALMLEMLRHFRQCESERRLRFVFMDLEETGRTGSRYHGEQLVKNKKDTPKFIGSIVVDTIGWADPKSPYYLGVMEVGDDTWHSYYDARVKFAQELMYVVRRVGIRDGLVISPETSLAQSGSADHGSYWSSELPAVLLAAPLGKGFVNPHYHRPTDKMEHINWDYYRRMAQVVTEMTAYAVRAKFKDPKQLSEKNWEVLAELENKSVLPDDPLPQPAEHEPALPKEVRGFWERESDDSSPAPIVKAITANTYLPAYVERYLTNIRESEEGEPKLFMFSRFEGRNRGFVYAKDKLMILDSDSNQTITMIFDEVMKKKGMAFTVSQNQPPQTMAPSYHSLFNTFRNLITPETTRISTDDLLVSRMTTLMFFTEEAPRSVGEGPERTIWDVLDDH